MSNLINRRFANFSNGPIGFGSPELIRSEVIQPDPDGSKWKESLSKLPNRNKLHRKAVVRKKKTN